MKQPRPTHLIFFTAASDTNVSKLSSILQVGVACGVRTRASCAVLASKHGVNPMVFERVAVGVASLTDEEAIKLAKDDAVACVMRNEMRTLPPFEGASTIITGQSLGTWTLKMIGLEGRDRLGGKGSKLAVLDTGIDLRHPDFHDRVEEGTTAVSFVTDESVQDGNGHGTHCAGIACGPRLSSSGQRYGVAPDAALLVGKVLDDKGYGWDDQILNGIDWAADMGADVISMSLGTTRSQGAPFIQTYERVASILLKSGVIMVGAAGNSSRRPAHISPVQNPAACPSIIAVGAVDQEARIATFSCGKQDEIGEITLVAPGVEIFSSWKNGQYRRLSGTSMAAPHVSGILSLLKQQQPEASGQDLWGNVTNHARPLGPAPDYGAGLVQMPA